MHALFIDTVCHISNETLQIKCAEDIGMSLGNMQGASGQIAQTKEQIKEEIHKKIPNLKIHIINTYIDAYQKSFRTANKMMMDRASALAHNRASAEALFLNVIPSDRELILCYKKSYPHASEKEYSLFVSFYKKTFEQINNDMKVKQIQDAINAGTLAGSRLAEISSTIPMIEEIKKSYEEVHMDHSIHLAYVDSFISAFKLKRMSLLKAADNFGLIDGELLAQSSDKIPTNNELKDRYKEKNRLVTDEECTAYASSFEKHYYYILELKLSGFYDGIKAVNEHQKKPTLIELINHYQQSYPLIANKVRCSVYAQSFIDGYDKALIAKAQGYFDNSLINNFKLKSPRVTEETRVDKTKFTVQESPKLPDNLGYFFDLPGVEMVDLNVQNNTTTEKSQKGHKRKENELEQPLLKKSKVVETSTRNFNLNFFNLPVLDEQQTKTLDQIIFNFLKKP